MPAPSSDLRLAVAIATVGRPETLAQTLKYLTRQTRRPDTIRVCAPSKTDLGDLSAFPDVSPIIGRRGLPHQRNDLLKALRDCDIVIFFDDDFFACNDYIAAVEAAFKSHLDVVMMSGLVLADGIIGPGLDPAIATKIIENRKTSQTIPDIHEIYNGYGCNMAVRLKPIITNGLLFDENLPLYGWLEDVDFSRRLALYGRIVSAPAAQGVHLGVKSGRQSGYRLGYSQIANPVYLVRKGSFKKSRAIKLVLRNFTMNFLKSFAPEPFVDRKGRLLGNLLGIRDLALRTIHPSKILSM